MLVVGCQCRWLVPKLLYNSCRLGLVSSTRTIEGGSEDPELGLLDAYQKACEFSADGATILTGGSDGERVKCWAVPELKLVSSLMPKVDNFSLAGEVDAISTCSGRFVRAPKHLIA